MKNLCCCLFLICCLACPSYGKDVAVTLRWPQDKPAIKFTFGKFQQIGGFAGQNTYVCDVLIENLTDKR